MEYSPYLVYVIVSLETLKISDLPCPSDNTGCQCQDLQQSIDKVVGPTMHNLQIFAIILLLRKECGLPILTSPPHTTLANMQLHGTTSSILHYPCWLTMSYHIFILKTLEPKGSWISKPCLTLCIWNSLFSPCSTRLIFWHLIWSAL